MGDVEAKVTLGGEAQISAGAGARLMSDTFVYVNSYDKGSFPKFNVSLAGNVVTADTKTIVSGSASVVSAGDLRVDARSRAASYAVSMATPTDALMPTARSGIFLGANFAFAETMAQVLDGASLESGAGNVSVEADGIASHAHLRHFLACERLRRGRGWQPGQWTRTAIRSRPRRPPPSSAS